LISAVDANILVDILIDSPRQALSRQLLKEARSQGYLIIAPVVYAELVAMLGEQQKLQEFLDAAGIQKVEQFGEKALWLAGEAWKLYNKRRPQKLVCPGCGSETEAFCPGCQKKILTRQHILTDFLVGAHAQAHANQLLTHDLGFVRSYFPKLRCLPEETGSQYTE
jgi:predicted nucleic acid-binding protein